LAAGTAYFFDNLINFVQPIFFYSSNWANVNGWCGHAPFVVNPDCGSLPEPTLFVASFYIWGFLAIAILLNAGMRALRRRRPAITTTKLVLFTFGLACLVDIAIEKVLIDFHLWAYPAYPGPGVGGGATRLPVAEILIAAFLLSTGALLRYFRDDKGRAVIERGLENAPVRARSIVSVLAFVGVIHTMFLLGVMASWSLGPYSPPYKSMPSSLVNRICDAPGITGTRYGPCPGAANYKMPIRRLPK
jgi:hypothetical protein